MKRTTTLLRSVLASVVASAIVLAGCRAAAPTPLAAEVIVSRTIASVAALKSYSMDLDLASTTNMTMTNKGQPQSATMTANGTGRGDFDLTRKASKFTIQMKVNSQAPLGQSFQMQADTYLIDGVVYEGVTDESGKTTWTKMTAPGTDGGLPDAATLNDIIEMVKGAPVEKLGEEQVNGKTAYVIKVTPDMQKLLALMMKGDDLPTEGLDVAKVIGNAVKSFSVKMWISKDDLLPLKEEAQMAMVFDSGALGLPAAAGTFNMTMDISSLSTFSYNTKVSITVPPEALAAPERPALQ